MKNTPLSIPSVCGRVLCVWACVDVCVCVWALCRCVCVCVGRCVNYVCVSGRGALISRTKPIVLQTNYPNLSRTSSDKPVECVARTPAPSPRPHPSDHTLPATASVCV